MDDSFRPAVGRNAAMRRVFVTSMALILVVGGASTRAEDPGSAFDWGRTYAGLIIGSGLTQNRLVDVDGFANEGHPGSVSEYDDQGFAWGALAGSRFEFAGTPLRVEVDATFGDLSASTNRLDPTCSDESAEAIYHWVTTARAAIEESLGGATVYATAGLAVARVDNSVTDLDFVGACLNPPLTRDADDSFTSGSTEIGWVVGVGVETALTDGWKLRLDGSYFDFGRNSYYVNRSGEGQCCGNGTPRRPVRYQVENSLGIVRLGLIRRFGP